ncbi:hypothetical protein GTR02_02810 [Kineococcus sp. R8]|uniref:hypothetical protein n=1 Tax=Kineococcus siccus TaxID=2696567 RepID=UPI001411D727|nr:hypothetical protein [Kineococcus siccus]NAZ80749.1 hypothetical protein [Kineococcus siccus]
MSHAHTSNAPAEGQRALAPMRKLQPNKGVVVALLIWLVGLLLAGVVPLILLGANPYEAASTAMIVTALSFTLAGCLVMVFSAYLLYRKTNSIGAAILAFVPSFTLATLGMLMTTMKALYGT